MNERTTSILLICFVALSIVYCYSSTILPCHATESIDAVHSRPTTLTKEPCQNVKLSYPRPNWNVLGDPIDNPRPK